MSRNSWKSYGIGTVRSTLDGLTKIKEDIMEELENVKYKINKIKNRQTQHTSEKDKQYNNRKRTFRLRTKFKVRKNEEILSQQKTKERYPEQLT